MTNPAVEALKKINLILLDVGRASSRDMLATTVHLARKIAKEALAQAEQTPVAEVAKAGRVVSEELWAMLLSRFSDPKATTTEKAILEALRAAPVYHKEES